MRWHVVAGLLAIGTLGAASPGTSQTGAAIYGMVKDPDGKLVDSATVEVLGTNAKAVSDADGHFALESIPAGRYWVLIRRPGFVPSRVSATLGQGESREVGFEIERLSSRFDEGTALADLGITPTRFQDFQGRSQSAFGTFLTRDDLGGLSGDLISVVQKYLPGRSRSSLEQRYNGTAFGGGLTTRRVGRFLVTGPSANAPYVGQGCAPAVSVNGARPRPSQSLRDFDRDTIEAVEIYWRGSWSPTEFAYRGNSGCGLVVVWLK